jgi:anti-sigma regulatory factor (Ser/Thr protein kinase)
MPDTLTLFLPPRAASTREARTRVRDLVSPSWPAECVATLQVLVAELVTNAVLHARSDAELSATIDGHRARIEVRDRSTRMPTALHYGSGSITGRGLHLVDALAERWGVDEASDGKVVWFEIECGGDRR